MPLLKFQKPEKKEKQNFKEDILNIFRTKAIVKKKEDIKEKYFLTNVLKKGGYDNIDVAKFKSSVLYLNIIFVAVMSILALVYGVFTDGIVRMLVIVLIMWVLVFPLVLLMSWVGVFFFLDYKRYRRRVEIEEVWPEFLQLVVANINAGMLIDVAMWSAVKPKFKILAHEIEEVAKKTITGTDLKIALMDFADKYDSPMLKRTISILIEGMEAGGQIATLLNKIALDIQETKIMKKEMAASVMTYAIFISFATMAAAPFLFGLSTELLVIIQGIMGTVSQASTNSSFFSFNANAIAISDFRIFAYVMLTLTSFMSAAIISTIRKGSIRDGMKYIPMFMLSSVIMYFLAAKLLAIVMGGLV
jgi:pilus assembly protein TadC